MSITIRLFIITLVVLITITNTFSATYNNVDISTGIRADLPGNPTYSYTQTDKFWRVVKTPYSQQLINQAAYVPNTSIGTFSAWNVIPTTRYINSNQTKSGDYEYQRCFCLDNPKNAQINLTVRADNKAKVFLNNYSTQILSIAHNDSFKKQPGIATFKDGFLAGRNCIRIRVNNEGSITGMDAKVSVSGWGAKEIVTRCCAPNNRLFDDKQFKRPIKRNTSIQNNSIR